MRSKILAFSADDSELDSDLASDDDNEESDDIDYFADVPSDSEGGARGTKRAHYEDFFDAPDDEEEINHPKVKQKARQGKKLERDMTEEEREEGEGEGDSPDSDVEEERSGGGEVSELSEDEESEGEGEGEIEGEGSTGESETDEEEEEEEGEEEDSEGEKQQTLSSHEKKQLKVSYMYAPLFITQDR